MNTAFNLPTHLLARTRGQSARSKMLHGLTMMLLLFSLSLVLSACNNKKYAYSSDKKLAASLLHLSPDEIKSVACRSHLESEDSFFSPPVIEPRYQFVGMVYLDDSYQAISPSEGQKQEISIQYPTTPPANTIQDWRVSPQWNQQLMREGFSGELYYSQSAQALYFELHSR